MSDYNRKVKVPDGADVISTDALRDIIEKCYTSMSKTTSIDSHSTMFYEAVLKELRKNNKFYVGLNSEVVTSLLYEIQGLTYDTVEEEFDTLCWRKVNKFPYNKNRLHELKSLLDV